MFIDEPHGKVREIELQFSISFKISLHKTSAWTKNVPYVGIRKRTSFFFQEQEII